MGDEMQEGGVQRFVGEVVSYAHAAAHAKGELVGVGAVEPEPAFGFERGGVGESFRI